MKAVSDSGAFRALPFWQLPRALSFSDGSRELLAPIHTDFRVGIQLRSLWGEAYYLAHPQRLLDTTIRTLFCDPAALSGFSDASVLEGIVWYLLDGRLSRREVGRRIGMDAMASGSNAAAFVCGAASSFSYKWDMPLLYASFYQVYRIDLFSVCLHLWQFDALMQALPRDCVFQRTLELRSLDLSRLPDDDTRASAAAARQAVRLPNEDEINAVCFDSYACGNDGGFHAAQEASFHNNDENGGMMECD